MVINYYIKSVIYVGIINPVYTALVPYEPGRLVHWQRSKPAFRDASFES
jgi:hypothetical protein